MENYDNHIDNLFRDGLGDYAETPPPAAWGALEKKLKAVPAPGTPKQLPYKRLGYVVIAGLAIMLMIQFSGNLGNAVSEKRTSVAANGSGTEQTNNLNNTSNKEYNDNKINELSSKNENNNLAPGNRAKTATTTGQTTNSDRGNENSNDYTEAGQSATGVNDRNTNNKKQAGKSKKTPTSKTAMAANKQVASGNKSRPQTAAKGNKTTGSQGNETEEEQIVYNSSAPKSTHGNPAPEETTEPEVKAVAKPQTAPEVNTPKTTTEDKGKKPAITKKPAQQKRPQFNRFEAGIKLGYERGFDNDAAVKFLVSPYLQYNLSPKFAIMTQPSVKRAETGSRQIGASKSYYRANNDSMVVQNGPSVPWIGFDLDSNGASDYYTTYYKYAQTHDSIIKTNNIGGSYVEVDIPLLLKYAIVKNFSVYAGVNLTYNKTTVIRENTNTVAKILIDERDSMAITRTGQRPEPPSVNSVIRYSGNEFNATYTGPQYPTTSGSTWGAGYMVGFSLEISKKLVLDALIQQSSAKRNVQAGYDVNRALSAPYFRFTIGYKLVK